MGDSRTRSGGKLVRSFSQREQRKQRESHDAGDRVFRQNDSDHRVFGWSESKVSYIVRHSQGCLQTILKPGCWQPALHTFSNLNIKVSSSRGRGGTHCRSAVQCKQEGQNGSGSVPLPHKMSAKNRHANL